MIFSHLVLFFSLLFNFATSAGNNGTDIESKASSMDDNDYYVLGSPDRLSTVSLNTITSRINSTDTSVESVTFPTFQAVKSFIERVPFTVLMIGLIVLNFLYDGISLIFLFLIIQFFYTIRFYLKQ